MGTPHYVLYVHVDSYDANLYHYPNKELAQKHIKKLLADELGELQDDDYNVKIAAALRDGEIDEALRLYRAVALSYESIEYGEVIFRNETPTECQVDEIIQSFLEKE